MHFNSRIRYEWMENDPVSCVKTSVDRGYDQQADRVWWKVRVGVEGGGGGGLERVPSCGPPPQWHLLVPVKRCCPWLKGTDHLLHYFVKEHTGQLRVQNRLELKRHLQRTHRGDKWLHRSIWLQGETSFKSVFGFRRRCIFSWVKVTVTVGFH